MTTKHAHDCRMVFGRKDPACPRCQELIAGAPPRAWRGSRRRDEETRRIAAIRAHDCKAAGCGPVCTAFDW